MNNDADAVNINVAKRFWVDIFLLVLLLYHTTIAILNDSDKFVGVVDGACLPLSIGGNHRGIAPTIITQMI